MSATLISQLSGSPRIDILIPAIDKDLATLPYVIDSLRKYVQHPIGKIYIVSPNTSSRIKSLCIQKNCTFIDEKTILPFTKKDIHYSSSRWDRSGWLYQQLLKMNGDRLCRENYFLVIDADTILIRSHRFRSNGKPIFYCRHWSQPEYFRTYRKLLGTKAPSPRSFVTHYMLFERTKLAQLKRKIEARHGLPWYTAIIRSINKKQQFGFSEFETYANYIYSENPSAVILRNAQNKSLATPAATLSQARKTKLSQTYRSLSFHQRKGYSRISKS